MVGAEWSLVARAGSFVSPSHRCLNRSLDGHPCVGSVEKASLWALGFLGLPADAIQRETRTRQQR